MQPMAGRPDYDQPLKRLLLRAHDGFLRLVAPGLTWRGELSPELPAASRRADLIWEVERPDGQRGILHIELQTKPDPEIGQRMAEYGLRLWLRDGLPVRSLVVFLRQAETLAQSPFVVEWMGEERLRYVFDVIRLWEVASERVLETPYYDLWPLAGLMAGVTAEATVAVAERIAVAPLPAHEREDLINQRPSEKSGMRPSWIRCEAWVHTPPAAISRTSRTLNGRWCRPAPAPATRGTRTPAPAQPAWHPQRRLLRPAGRRRVAPAAARVSAVENRLPLFPKVAAGWYLGTHSYGPA
jgi:hypothetical protein